MSIIEMSTVQMGTVQMGAVQADAMTTAASPRTATKPRLRITERGRAVLLTIVAAPIIAVMLVLALNGGGATATLDAGAPAEIVMIEPGQSLWALAESIAPGADPRDVIEELVSFNRLASADVWAGQEIAIPQHYSH